MKEFKFTITDPVGFHARPAGQIAKEIKNFASAVTVFKGDKSADMSKLLKVMGLGIKQGDEITVKVEGEDEAAAAAAIEAFLKEHM
ncbi:MAG: HPr family phosphocarrier protein [Stomatobaculum sp.]